MLTQIYDALFARYGELRWWPASSPYAVIAGAILTQNTAWSNVEKAIANFGEDLSPELVANLSLEELSSIIKPAGFFNQKAVYLKEVTRWFCKYNYNVENVRQLPFDFARKELLSLKGVGRETADSILLYAFGFPSFVIDAYTLRLLSRLPINAGRSYDEVKLYFESNLLRDSELYNNFHAMIVINAKEHCRKKPSCPGCPLFARCSKFLQV